MDKTKLAWARNGYSTKRHAEADAVLVAAARPQDIGKITVKRGGWWWRDKK